MKVVTYRQLLQDADAFGQGETLSGAVGTLSLTDSERESGYSVSSLFVKYRTQLVLVPAACKEVTLHGHCLVKNIKCVN